MGEIAEIGSRKIQKKISIHGINVSGKLTVEPAR